MADQIGEQFGSELKGLQTLVEQRREGVLAFGLYSDSRVPKDAVEWLRSHSAVPVSPVRVTPDSPDPRQAIRDFPPTPRRCFLFLDVEAGFPKLLGYVNLNREALLKQGHALVFWIREEGLRRIASEAPDFWAWRSRVFDFRTVHQPEIGPSGPRDAAIGHYETEDIERQVLSLEQQPAEAVSQLALGRRQLVLRNYAQADTALSRAVEKAERANDLPGLAEATFLLGNSKLEQGQLVEAEALYQRSWEMAVASGREARRLAVIRQLSLLEQMRGNLELAHEYAVLALLSADKLQDLPSLAGTYDQLGNVLFLKKELRGAEEAYHNALKYEEMLGHRSDLAFTLVNLSKVHEEMGALTEAEQELQRAAMLFRELGDGSQEAQVRQMLERMRVEHA
jgi:tetratricopeptide (TPR) repeat protein